MEVNDIRKCVEELNKSMTEIYKFESELDGVAKDRLALITARLDKRIMKLLYVVGKDLID